MWSQWCDPTSPPRRDRVADGAPTVTTGQCLNCNVCIPPLAGDKPSQKEAAAWRANISRLFDNKAESDFQVRAGPARSGVERGEEGSAAD